MKKKIVLKPWVKAFLLLLPELIIIGQLFFVGSKVSKLVEQNEETRIIVEMRCNDD